MRIAVDIGDPMMFLRFVLDVFANRVRFFFPAQYNRLRYSFDFLKKSGYNRSVIEKEIVASIRRKKRDFLRIIMAARILIKRACIACENGFSLGNRGNGIVGAT